MAKTVFYVHSRYASEACQLLGSLIRESRIKQGMTVAEFSFPDHRSCRRSPGVFASAYKVYAGLFCLSTARLANFSL